jgi:hypothetical protein
MSDKPKITDFPDKLEELAQTIIEQAMKLPKAQFDMRLDAFKAATAYQSMKHKAPDAEEGSLIGEMRANLLKPAPRPAETDPEPEPLEDDDERPEAA